jgi:hypothetical protein
MSVKTVAAVAVGLGILAASAGGYIAWRHYNNEWACGPGSVIELKDKAIAWARAEDYWAFRRELSKYEGPQQESYAASMITSDRVALLPAQRAELIGIDGPLALIRTLDGACWVTQISQIEDDTTRPEGVIEDRIAQMIDGQ